MRFEIGASRLGATGKLAGFGQNRALVRPLMILEIIFAPAIDLPISSTALASGLVVWLHTRPRITSNSRAPSVCHLASKGAPLAQSPRMSGCGLNFPSGRISTGLQIMDVAMGILRDRRGCGMRMQGERAAGGG